MCVADEAGGSLIAVGCCVAAGGETQELFVAADLCHYETQNNHHRFLVVCIDVDRWWAIL